MRITSLLLGGESTIENQGIVNSIISCPQGTDGYSIISTDGA